MAIHSYKIVIDVNFDDEDGEYTRPTTTEIERKTSSHLAKLFDHMGFDNGFNIEAEEV